MKVNDFETMYLTGLQEARGLEETLLQALPKLADAADDRELAETLRSHLAETRTHFDRIRDLLARNSAMATAPADASIGAIVALAETTIATMRPGPVRDVTLIALVQRIEHQEIAIYGTLAAYAKMLGRHDEKRVLGAILEEERGADEDLTDIAVRLVSPPATSVPLRADGRAGGVAA